MGTLSQDDGVGAGSNSDDSRPPAQKEHLPEFKGKKAVISAPGSTNRDVPGLEL